MSENQVQRLIDEADLCDLIHRYAFGLDNEDWALWRSVFADTIVMDLSDYQPQYPPKPTTPEKLLKGAEVTFAGLDRSQHFIGSHRYAIDGDTAVITAHMRAEHWLTSGKGGDRYTMYGTYENHAIRTPDGWKFTRVKLHLIREEGNRYLMAEAGRKGKAKLADA
jgi:hypothetical protein